VKSPSRGPHLAKYSMRGSSPPHPTLLAFINIKHAYTVTASIATSPILEAPGAQSLFRGSQLANTQCEALYRRIRRYLFGVQVCITRA